MPSSFADAMTDAIKRRAATHGKPDEDARKKAAEEAQKRLGYGVTKG